MSTGVCVCVGLGMAGPGTIIVGGEEVEPLIYFDFKEGIYTADGEAVTVGDLLVEDANFGTWNPARIVADTGLVGNTDVAPVFDGDALALVIAGSTIVAYFTGTQNIFRFELVDSSDYNTYYSFAGRFGSEGTAQISDDDSPIEFATLPTGYHKLALTFIDGKVACSIDGGAVMVIDPGHAWSPPMGVMNMVVPLGVTLETLGLYPPQDNEDLQALSATGAPVLTVVPVISGAAQVGETVSITTGTWTDAVSYAYQWRRSGFVIEAATDNDYEVVLDDVDMTLSCIVVATNASGSASTLVVDDEPVIAAP